MDRTGKKALAYLTIAAAPVPSLWPAMFAPTMGNNGFKDNSIHVDTLSDPIPK